MMVRMDPGERASDDPSPDGTRLLGTSFPDDDGAPDGELRAALAASASGAPGAGVEALALLQDARLLVPVVAVLGEVETDDQGLARDKSSDMAAVLLTGADGRQALLAFTGTDSLTAWDPGARPVPVAARLAARAAVQEQAAAVVVDVAGPATYVLSGQDLTALAAGWRLASVDGAPAWITGGPGAGPATSPDSVAPE